MNRNAIVLSLVAAASIASAPAVRAAIVNQVIFSDQTYADANWTVVNSFHLESAGQVASGGNPGSYRQVILIVGQNLPFVGQLNNTFVYDPSLHGAITGITYNVDLITTNAESAAYFPLLAQNGKFYLDAASIAGARTNVWTNQNLVLDLADFGLLKISAFDQLVVDHTATPDFSAAGSAITFGYEVETGGAGFFGSVTGIDNDPITLTVIPSVAGGVPELSTWAMMLIGFGLVGRRVSRRRGRPIRLTVPLID